MKIKVCEPTLSHKAIEYATDAIKSGWISSSGKYIDLLEKKYAEHCGTKYAISCSSGTAALHLALKAILIHEGDEVLVPSFTMCATANAVAYCGATPVFIDSDLTTWNLNIDMIESRITDKTKAIIVVHTYGNPVDMDRVMDIAKRHELWVIEDAAEAQGATYKGKMVGNLGHIACFSGYANKTLCCGEGGMVTTNIPEVNEMCRKYRNHCFTQDRFHHMNIGFNYRLTNVQAAIWLSQLEEADKLVNMRIKNAMLYNKHMMNIWGVNTPPASELGTNVYWMYGITLDSYYNKDKVMKLLAEKGIETRSFFYPMHLQVSMKPYTQFRYQDDTASEYLYYTGFYLPSSSHLKEEEIKYICDTLKDILENYESDDE
jgi:perosamine synthetase